MTSAEILLLLLREESCMQKFGMPFNRVCNTYLEPHILKLGFNKRRKYKGQQPTGTVGGETTISVLRT